MGKKINLPGLLHISRSGGFFIINTINSKADS